MDICVGDVIELKKQHPCGARHMTVLRIGMDFRLRCNGCGREMMVPRARIERYIRAVLRGEDADV